ncbi:hypothetical protein DL96DRAFT_1665976 [Flagelloscypha sp. PMI_526]|nr:hypothetical protein DL96DRAFT_1665976 [Flagelloscypha sp. PMI_526]
MFRNCVAQCSRTAPASISGRYFLHTSIPRHAAKRDVARATRKANTKMREEQAQQSITKRAHPVLGYKPGEEDRWTNCELAQLLITEETLLQSSPDYEVKFTEWPDLSGATVPKETLWGVDEAEKKMLFEELPWASSQLGLTLKGQASQAKMKRVSKKANVAVARELEKSRQLARLVDLRNADAGGLAFENRRRIIHAFSTPEKPFDTGRAEVQAALMTYQIQNLWKHLTTFKRDVGNRRAKMLKYLKRKSLDRYETLLTRLGLDPESVEGELIV